MKNMMLKFRNHKVGFKEVEDIAERLMVQQKNVNKNRIKKYAIVKDLMKHKMDNVLENDKMLRKDLKASKEILGEIVRVGTYARNEFMDLVNGKIDIIWKEGKEKNYKKVERADEKNKVVKEDMEIYKGVKIGDKQLEELEKVIKNQSVEPETCVYGGVELKDDLKDILNLPPTHTTFPPLKVEQFDTELQKCEVKSRWQSHNEQRKNENRKKKEELGDDTNGEDEETKEVFSIETKTLDFRNLKATDMKMNKRIVMPELNDDEEDIRRSNRMS